MATTQRVTITLPLDVLEQARQASDGNISKLIADVLHTHFESERRRKLRESLIAGYQAHAEEALEMAEAFRYAEDEAVALYVPPYTEHAIAEQLEPELVKQDD